MAPERGDLFRWLDTQFERLALDAAALACAPPATIPGSTLERAGYFEAFADVAIPAPDSPGSDAGSGAYFAPAACYHVYAALEGQRLDGPRLVTLAATCGRREARAGDDPGRLERFRMREVVFIGAADWVAGERDAWMARATAFASSIGMAGIMEPATDTFFGVPGRGRRLIQQVKKLKYELRMDAGRSGRLAVASFNLHETFFGSRFGIRLADGSPAASGCAAFGIERWTLACLAQLGPVRAAALAGPPIE